MNILRTSCRRVDIVYNGIYSALTLFRNSRNVVLVLIKLLFYEIRYIRGDPSRLILREADLRTTEVVYVVSAFVALLVVVISAGNGMKQLLCFFPASPNFIL